MVGTTTALACERSRNDCRVDSPGDRARGLAGAFRRREFGDNNVANASARKMATPNLQVAQVLRRRATFVKDEQITTRQFRVTTHDNVLGDPLSRGPKYMSLFKKNARDQGATSFVRMKTPAIIFSLLGELAELHPMVVRVEEQQRALRLQTPVRQRRSPSPSATAQAHTSKRTHSLQDLGISRNRWRYVANFARLGTMLEIAGELGGSPACGADNHGPARVFWESRTGRVCFADFATFREIVADPEQRAHHLDRVLIYLPGPPRINFSIAGFQLGTAGGTGQLFLDDAACALETDAPIVVSEIVLGILDQHLKVFLDRKVATLRLR